ncbi:uncharacterized protein LOC121243149 [Juglans microcarpa x Juglans regia]|uniref:uncharacterized protein LOC121243149 n=1 Tax=Juglans microcarpa x Juglans regia TaxID=2249226 RepID=UPI001B7EEF2D|nr:uncharacterized protein LOC121243149 [Juglans microcarpa x Juglans regia]
MSRSSLAKKLHLAKKAWKSFNLAFQSKLHKLKTSKVITTTTRRLRALRTFRFPFPFKRYPLPRPSYTYSQHYHYSRHNHSQSHKMNFAAIHIDELFEGPAASVNRNTLHARAETSKGKQMIDERSLPKRSKSIHSVEDAWEAVIASSPQLRNVDERAEEFISKFREDMKLQKERSFQEMLERSA